ncbi:unnamed protein product [Ostreobium quekettii]|uniref:NAD(P)-binding domain-containing protein n=1 Tax=Ostreobium quekettii TaxID=121088 RepID=A0A8S1J874_9CHLO|nr:unnamed protein product [Ostreobium quekettii]
MDARADSEGNINLIEAAAKKGAKRFLLVTSIGTGDSKDAVAKQTYEVLEKVLIEKEKAERRLKELGSEMEYVIIRPGGLKSEPATGEGFLTDDNTVCGSIHRDDVASLVVDALFSDKATNKVLAALDKNQVNGKPVLKPFEV